MAVVGRVIVGGCGWPVKMVNCDSEGVGSRYDCGGEGSGGDRGADGSGVDRGGSRAGDDSGGDSSGGDNNDEEDVSSSFSIDEDVAHVNALFSSSDDEEEEDEDEYHRPTLVVDYSKWKRMHTKN